MLRHSAVKKLRTINPASLKNEVWRLSPFAISRFSGELAQVMLNAANSYIYEKCLAEQKQDFLNEAFPDQKPS